MLSVGLFGRGRGGRHRMLSVGLFGRGVLQPAEAWPEIDPSAPCWINISCCGPSSSTCSCCCGDVAAGGTGTGSAVA